LIKAYVFAVHRYNKKIIKFQEQKNVGNLEKIIPEPTSAGLRDFILRC
jgi:hypothetical protein